MDDSERCNHKWYFITNWTYRDKNLGYVTQETVEIRCPCCGQYKEVDLADWLAIKKIQELREQNKCDYCEKRK